MATEITFNQWARQQEPELEILSSSTPEPRFKPFNLIERVHQPDVARRVVLEWERIEPADGSVGMVVMGHPIDHSSTTEQSSVDPEGVAKFTMSRVLKGGLPGALIGAVLVTLFVLILEGWSQVLIGAALGGLAFGFVAGAVLSFVKGTGWGAAFESSFADQEAASVIYASIHSESSEHIDRAAEVASAYEDVTLFRVDRSGHIIDVTARS